MILDSFCHPLNQMRYPKVLEETIQYLKNLDFSQVPVGRHEIKGDDIFINIAEYESFPREERIIEAHKEYVDIQFLTEGEEKIGFGVFSEKNEIKEEYDKERDLLVYGKLEKEFDLILTPGVFAVFFTEEPHRPCVMLEKPVKVKKYVVKIRKSLLED
ncbi:MAG: YhcH/YjgK/YiaL family protein [Fusobacteriaceae bacterium]